MIQKRADIKKLIITCMIPVVALGLHTVAATAITCICGVSGANDDSYSGLSIFISYALYILVFGVAYYKLLNKAADNIYAGGVKKTVSHICMQYKEENSEKPWQASLSFLLINIISVITGISLQITVSGILAYISSAYPQLLDSYNNMVEQSFSAVNGMLTVFTISIISPIGEELAFRGVALKLSQEACYNSIAPILITAVLFGLYHGNPVQICYAIPAGIILALVAVKSSSIIPATILHIAVNVTSYLLPETISRLAFVTGVLCLAICLTVLCKLDFSKI
jgi:hypothetical protein